MDGDLVTPGGILIPRSALAWTFSRSGGPGGQGVNTTDSRVELVADLSVLEGSEDALERVRTALGSSVRIVASERRSQLRNREDALERLVERVDAAARPRAPRTPTRPRRSAVRKRVEEKRRRGQVKQDRRAVPPSPD